MSADKDALPDASPRDQGTRRKRRWAAGIFGIGFLLVSILISLDYYSAAPADALSQATYVGKQSCAQCHQEQVDAHYGSHHDRSMDRATEASVLGDFSGVELEHHGIVSRMFREGERYMIHTEGPDGEMADFEIKYVFGVEPLQQYMVELERAPDAKENEIGRVQVLRVSWDTKRKEWFYLNPPNENQKLDPSDMFHWTGSTQNWNHTCAECHSTDLVKNYSLEEMQYRTTFSEIDVSCEACHGPGSLHVELAEAKSLFWDRRHGYGLPTLKSKDPEHEIQTCAKCHSRHNTVHANFRPGKNFYDHYTNAQLAEQIYHPDGQVLGEDFVHGSFIQSRMYKMGVRCTDCHDPHTATLLHEGNKLCTSCHQHEEAKYDTPAHHHHAVGSPGASCVECHMPETTFMAVDPRRDHSIRVPRPDLSVDLGTPNACSRCHVDVANISEEKHESLPYYAKWLYERDAGDEEIAAEIGRVDARMLDAFTRWYGEQEDRGEHFAYALKAAWENDPEGAADLVRVVRNRRIPPLIRASALTALARYPSSVDRLPYQLGDLPTGGQLQAMLDSIQDMLGDLPAEDPVMAMLDSLNDPSPLVRASALMNLQRVQPLFLKNQVVPMLDDPIRLVRSQAAQLLMSLDQKYLEHEVIEKRAALLADLIQELENNGDQANSLSYLGQIYESLKDGYNAELSYRNAIRVQPEALGPRSNLASLLSRFYYDAMEQGQTERALAFADEVNRLRNEELHLLEKGAHLAPDAGIVQYQYAYALYQMRQIEKAEIYYLKAAELEPDNFNFLLTLVTFYKEFERWDEGLPWAEELYRRNPDNRNAQIFLLEFQQMTAPEARPPGELGPSLPDASQ